MSGSVAIPAHLIRAPGQPVILPARRVDWCTSADVLDVCYEVYDGAPFGIDPASNAESIVRALHAFTLPSGADLLDPVGGLAVPWHEYGTFFVNPPFGKKVIKLWIRKAIEEVALGAEGVMLLPAYVSAHFFDEIYRHASVICLWGKPGQSSSRVRFVGAKDSAAFPIMLVYFGPRVYRAAECFDRVGHIILPRQTRHWMRLNRGDVTQEVSELDERSCRDPLFSYLKSKSTLRYDELISATADLQSPEMLLADAMRMDGLREMLQGLTLAEVAAGLASLRRQDVPNVGLPVPTSGSTPRIPRRPRAALAPVSQPANDAQISLLPTPSASQVAREERDRTILALLRQDVTDEGVLSIDLRRHLVDCSNAEYRSSMKRLCSRGLVLRTGKSTNTRYFYHRTR